jgi:hypothetical protein
VIGLLGHPFQLQVSVYRVAGPYAGYPLRDARTGDWPQRE